MEKTTVVVIRRKRFHYVKDDYNYKLNAFSLMLYMLSPSHHRWIHVFIWKLDCCPNPCRLEEIVSLQDHGRSISWWFTCVWEISFFVRVDILDSWDYFLYRSLREIMIVFPYWNLIWRDKCGISYLSESCNDKAYQGWTFAWSPSFIELKS